MRTLSAVVLLLLLSACGEAETPTASSPSGGPSKGPSEGTTADIPWIILTPGEHTRFYSDWQYERPKTEDVEKALEGAVQALETERRREDLPEFVDKRIWSEMLTGVLKTMPGYRCQAIGVTDEDGKRFVYLSFLAEACFTPGEDYDPMLTDEEWRTEAQVVDDGGDWFWQMKYDPETGTLYDIEINGEA